MTGTDIHYRPLTEADVSAYLALRREAVRDFPHAFTDAPDDVEATPIDQHRARLRGHYMLGAFAGETLVGNVGYYVCTPRKYSHRGYLHGMYVSPAWQGYGIGGALLRRLIDHARTVVEHLELSVNAQSAAIIRLYESAGFAVYGRLPAIMKLDDGSYVDDLYMWMPLR